MAPRYFPQARYAIKAALPQQPEVVVDEVLENCTYHARRTRRVGQVWV